MALLKNFRAIQRAWRQPAGPDQIEDLQLQATVADWSPIDLGVQPTIAVFGSVWTPDTTSGTFLRWHLTEPATLRVIAASAWWAPRPGGVDGDAAAEQPFLRIDNTDQSGVIGSPSRWGPQDAPDVHVTTQTGIVPPFEVIGWTDSLAGRLRWGQPGYGGSLAIGIAPPRQEMGSIGVQVAAEILRSDSTEADIAQRIYR